MAHERIKPEFLFDEEKIKLQRQITPECFEDGKINFEILRQNLGDWVQGDGEDELEHFGLFWPGKKDARRLATTPPEGTLEPLYGEGLKVDGSSDDDGVNDSKNIFIEGENLEVLKILQKSYANKIKMIYIDPPYNTGNDFVYDDDFTEPLQEYLRRTGQIDEEGKPLTTNKKSDGRFHSKWLSMMYPRLRLARNLLKEDGLIFISIDNNEVFNLKALASEVFGDENFVDMIIWKKRYGGGAKEKYLVTLQEYVLVYAKNLSEMENFYIPLEQESIDRYYKRKDNNFEKRGPFRTHPLEATKSVGRRENLVYPIPAPDGTEILPERQWWWDQERTLSALRKGELDFIKTKSGKWTVHTKQYLIEENGEVRKTKPFSMIENIYTQHGTNEIADIFGDSRIFTFPKPTELLLKLIDIANLDQNDIVLDFFAGSGPFAHSLWKKALRDKQQLKFILIQYPELINEKEAAYEKGYRKISEITKARLSLINEKYNKELMELKNSGFCAFSLTNSNYKKWNDVQDEDIFQLENSLDLFNSSPLRDDWNKNKLLAELILLEGYPLDASQTKSIIGSNEMVKVASELVPNTLLICLDNDIKEGLIEELELDNASTFICLDSAISNQNKLRLSDKGLIKTI